ncbi:hypothetical protein A2230_07015 [candidate division WOR-1 bacterium RIFOXYA2_FULL_36_21]|uniref:ArnT-like N-terminal domain-containing protein n=1 Tax=candidate division WOR-1 bacterium RIFOXYB2_FULL_36_35 TaxID=1802578 RepID=A0A1F4S316_UNCSA|nr:MAG: hypothetical protein A2230_07015 [candidate division WOR-1 bacterium RIFOXYA2_FULL_36_21]OGC14710.1 MAG: hypothetical protein A2282_02625 [candidate division WOR-1 bacterium RIFOXYA12_FULL_36_13]OGC14822.1 MAG: hypothetical protein A2290_00810 [candidate division WOR-1 bacterium RIFOXYB2_FULL_36_35]
MKKDILALAALGFVLFMLFAQLIPIIDGDTAFYATIAKNIIKSGDFITLKFVNTGDIIDKPPLAMWFMAVSFKLFGINEFALSLWHSLLAIGTVILTYLMGRELFGRRGGLLAGLILMLSCQFFYITRTPMLDIPLTFFITASFYCIFRLNGTKYCATTTSPIYYYIFSIALALALLTKGPVGIAIPLGALIILKFLTLTTFDKTHNSQPIHTNLFHLFMSTLLFLTIAAPWFIIEYKILGQPFANLFFLRNFLRFFRPTDIIGNLNTIAPQYDFYSYFLQIFLLFAPWGGFVYPAIFYGFKNKNQRLFLVWAAIAIGIFAFSLNYKIGRYILPAFPALAIIVTNLLENIMEEGEKLKKYILTSAWLNTVLLIPLFSIVTIYLFISFPKEIQAFKPIALPFLVVFSSGLIAGTIFLFKKEVEKSIITFVTASTLSYIIFIIMAGLFINKAMPTKILMQAMNEIGSEHKEDKIIAIVYKGEEPRQEYFYIQDSLFDKHANMDGPLYYIADREELVSTFKTNLRKKNPDILVGISKEQEIKKIKQIKIIKEINGYILFLSRNSYSP